jgi:hypothetical protein
VEQQKTQSRPSPQPSPWRERGQDGAACRAIRVGAMILVGGLALLFFPLLLDLHSLNKYVVAAGLIGVLVGLGCVTNGAIDALRARHR